MKKAVFPGSFDPITRGHCDILLRCTEVFETLILAVADTPNKPYTFTLKQRVSMIEKVIRQEGLDKRVEVYHFNGLLVHFLQQVGVRVLVRGVRSFSDFEYECRSFRITKQLDPCIETVFFVSHREYEHVSSSFVKELFELGGEVSEYVPEVICDDVCCVLRERQCARKSSKT